MIHVAFKEAATRVDTAERLEKLADALKAIGSEEKIMIYFEFDSPDQLRLFSLALQMMPHIGDLKTLEEAKDRLQKEVNQLEQKVTKLSEIKRYTRR